MPIMLAHAITRRLADGAQGRARVPYLRPDGKAQVTVRYRERRRPARCRSRSSGCWSRPSTIPTSIDERIRADVIEHVLRAGDAQATSAPHERLRRARLRARQPDRPLRHRRPDGRHRPDRPQDHRRHLRRRGPPRRRRVLRQGSVQGRPLRRLRRALGGQEHRRGRSGRARRGAGGLRDRRRPAGLGDRSRRSAPSRSTGDDRARPSARCSTCGRRRSSATSTCCGRSTATPPPTATSAATSRSRGSAPTAPRCCARHAGSDEPAAGLIAASAAAGHRDERSTGLRLRGPRRACRRVVAVGSIVRDTAGRARGGREW